MRFTYSPQSVKRLNKYKIIYYNPVIYSNYLQNNFNT